MKVAVVGAGNSGSALLINLAVREGISEILVASHRPDSAMAATMDVYSAYPQAAERIHCVDVERAGSADVVAVCAGLQIGKRQKARDVLAENCDIVAEITTRMDPRADQVFIVIGTPVD